ncbi:hypothetical protein BACPU_32980 [Bacillus pumilus]|nr:hypothetical protein BACPU_32980 [Bacillus pumilus]
MSPSQVLLSGVGAGKAEEALLWAASIPLIACKEKGTKQIKLDQYIQIGYLSNKVEGEILYCFSFTIHVHVGF